MRQKKKKKPKYGRIFLTLLIFGLVIYGSGKWLYDTFFHADLTYVVTVDTLNIEKSNKALILRNELVVDTGLTGKLKILATEGEYVAKGHIVAEVYNDGSNVEAVEATEKEQNRSKTEFDYNVLEYDIEVLKTQILFHLNEGDYADIPRLKRELTLKSERLGKLEEDHKFLSNRIAAYVQKTIGEGVLLEGQKQAIQAPASGTITFLLDGYENFLNIDNVYNINYEEVEKEVISPQSMTKEFIHPGDSIFKIIDNATYYLVTLVSNEDVETYKNIQNIVVELAGESLHGEVYDVFVNNDKAVVVIRMKDTFSNYQNMRWVECNIIRENYRGLKVPSDAIISSNGKIGVYVIEQDRTLRYVPIKVLGYDDEFAIVYNEQFYETGTGIVRSIQLNQEIVRNAHKYKIGDRID